MPNEETWETQEVINWLINDEGAYLATKNKGAWWLHRFVIENHEAPAGLYESFRDTKGARWSKVDWKAVTQACKG